MLSRLYDIKSSDKLKRTIDKIPTHKWAKSINNWEMKKYHWLKHKEMFTLTCAQKYDYKYVYKINNI